ncbi:MAG: acyltransferase [Bacteroidales bacterium]|jgi:hypothetical protein|nr:acyltransferase [Bacteroidales bacterium]
MTSEELQSKTINCLRFPLTAGVVLAHTVSDRDWLKEYIPHIDYTLLSGTDIYNLMRILLSDFIPRAVTVPCFFVFSGFLFFYKGKVWNRNIYFGKIKSRTKTLVIPYLLWNIIPLALAALFAFMRFDGSLSELMSKLQENGIFTIFWNYSCDGSVSYPYNIPMWYVRDLIVAAFCSPLVYYFVKYAKLIGVVILGVSYVLLTGMGIWFPLVMFFFTLGAWLAVHGKNMVVESRKGKWFWFCCLIVTLILSVYCLGTDKFGYIFALCNVSGSITMINIASRLIERGRVAIHPFLTQTSFFIYAVHGGILWKCNQALNILFDSTGIPVLTLKYFLAPAVCVCICVGVYWVAGKTVPKLLSILTGSR